MHLRGLCLLGLWASVAAADPIVIWSEDFSDVSDWQIVYDPGGGSTLSSDGDLAALFVNAAASEAAFIPNTAVAPFVPFDPSRPGDYTLTFVVAGLSYSTSYDVALDQFSAPHSGAFLSTVWQVFPSSGTSVSTGQVTISLGAVAGFDGAAQFLQPKINVHTGDGGQTVWFDEMTFSVVPEPSAALLAALGGCLLWRRRRR